MRKQVLIGDRAALNLPVLIRTRLLVQANSGGGKSYLLRRLLEQTHGKVQQLVIDVEGEFASLREKFDYVLAAKEGDTPADPRAAALLAERLLTLKVSAIMDLYELKHDSRLVFVQTFLDALVNAPKALWHPVLIIIDEAHIFCPQQGRKESPSAASVIDICTRGRKRGFCAVLATQRLSKLHKDAAAECNNVLIGRTSLDVDMDRSAEMLGFKTQEQRLSLRDLKPGEFFAYGPALSSNVTHVTVGPVITTHPKGGRTRLKHVPKPTRSIRKLLPKLADLPAESEQREQTTRQLKAELLDAKRRIQTLEHDAERAAMLGKVLTDDDLKAIERLGGRIHQLYEELTLDFSTTNEKFVNQLLDRVKVQWRANENKLTKTQYAYTAVLRRPAIKKIVDFFENHRDDQRMHMAPVNPKSPTSIVPKPVHKNDYAVSAAKYGKPAGLVAKLKIPVSATASDVEKLLHSEKAAHRRIFSAILDFPGASAKKIGALTAISPNISTFRLAVTKLTKAGLIVGDVNGYQLTTNGRGFAKQFPSVLSTGLTGVENWRAKLGGAPLRIFEVLLKSKGTPLLPEQIGTYAGVDHTVSTFRLAMTKLRKLDLISEFDGRFSINEELA